MTNYRKYETEPLQCFDKCAELLGNCFREAREAQAVGKKLGIAIGAGPGTLMSGIAGCEFLDLASLFAAEVAADPNQSIRFSDAAAARGYLPDICYPNLHAWGSMFLQEGLFEGGMQPDFCFQMHVCESQGKGAQVMWEHLGMPYFCLDQPLVLPENRRAFHDAYLARQLHDAIAWLEDTVGQPFNDEKFVEGVKNEWECRRLFGKVCVLQQTIPAPLDLRSLEFLGAPRLLMSHKREVVEFYRALYDEVQDRVRRQIAFLPTERCRLLHEGGPPFHTMSFFNHVERYGAVFIGGMVEFMLGGFERAPDGTWQLLRTLEERGFVVETRDDAVRLMVESMMENPATCGFLVAPRIEETVNRARDWHADGVVLHCDRGCQACPASMPEIRSALTEQGLPTMVYESSCGDSRELNEAHVIGSLESFMEVLGLSPIS